MKRLHVVICLLVLCASLPATPTFGQTCTIGGHNETSENFAPGGWGITPPTLGSGPAGLPVPHLVISEVAPRGFGNGVASDSSEYVEIYNPTARPVHLDDKYLSDDIGYYRIVNGPYPAANNTDWAGRFPAGLTLDPGRTLIVCVTKAGFAASGASAPLAQYVLEMRDSNANPTDDMTILTTVTSIPLIGGMMTNPSATNGEWIVLYCWNGVSDLVCDLDYASWGATSATNPKMNKSGISLDGPDAGAVPSAYNADTAPAGQSNLGAGTALTKPNTYQRVGGGEAAEVNVGGNGCLGRVQPTVINWLPVAGTDHIRFHVRWTNMDEDSPSSQVSGQMLSQDFGVFQPDFGSIGSFNVPPLQPSSFFDVFFEVPLSSLPPAPQKILPGGGPIAPPGLLADSGPATLSDCPPDTNWAGNVDIWWLGPGYDGMVNKHYADLLTCAGGPPSYIHFRGSNCPSPMPWTISGLAPGFSATLVNEDFTPAPNPVPVGWTGWICVSAAAGVPSGTSSCFGVTFTCDDESSTIDICSTACDWSNPQPPVLSVIDWVNVGSLVKFHLGWHNENTTTASLPVSGDLRSQPFGVFQPIFGHIGHFDVPPLPPNSFFDVFTEVWLADLPPEPEKEFTGGGPGPGSDCPPSQEWNGNVDVIWSSTEGPGMAQKHHGDLVVNLGSSPAYIHVGFTNCPNPAPWQILGLCPGFSATLVNEDKSPVLSGALPPGWSGWIKVAADASVPSNTTCCFQVKIVCNGSPGIIDMCATSCTWSVSTVPPVPDKVAFGIFRTAPSPASTGTVIDFVVPTSGPVRVEAFDLSGRQVRLVMTGPVEAGVHSVRWDMRGEGGSPIAPGTYFIKLSAAGQTSTRKIVLVR